MLSRSTKRMLLAGLLMASRSELGFAQEIEGRFLPAAGASSLVVAPPPIQVFLRIPVAEFRDIELASQSTPAPVQAPPPPKASDVPGPKAPDAKVEPPPANPEAPNFPPLTSAALGDSQVAMSAPQIMGDFGGYSIRKTIFVPVTLLTTTTQFRTVVTEPSSGPIITSTNLLSTMTSPSRLLIPVPVQVPVVSRAGSGFKIADDDSPIPTDRVFFSYNNFDGLRGQAGFNQGTFVSSTTTGTPVTVFPISATIVRITTTPGTTTSATVNALATATPQVDLNREIFGFEKTFLDGYASFELRVPIYQSMSESIANGGFAGDDFGDVTTVLKFALVKETDRDFSVGLATTFPTGPAIVGDDVNIRAVLFQPFVGFYRGYGDFFVQGFTSLVASTSSQDPTLIFNDYAFGYRLYRGPQGQFLTSVSPAFEVHVTTPLDSHGDDATGLIVTDIVSFTGAVHFGFGANSTLSVGCNVPATGPRPYNAEAIVQLNYRF